MSDPPTNGTDPAPESADLAAAIEEVLVTVGPRGAVRRLDPVSAGASRRTTMVEVTWDLDAAKQATDSTSRLVLQQELGEPRRPDGMRLEISVMAAAGDAGVPCPAVVAVNDPAALAGTTNGLGSSFAITEQVVGESIPRRILRDDRYTGARGNLVAQLARALARLHGGIDPARFPHLESDSQLSLYRERADELDLVSPAFELAFTHLEQERPEETAPVVVHGDFRLGNLLIDHEGLTAVLDWELVHLGQRWEDLAWLCVKAWRFGGDGPVAGLGPREELYRAYEEESGVTVDVDAVAWWELLGSLKWGIMCAAQAAKFFDGVDVRTEMLAIGNRIAEQEHDVLRLLGRRPRARPDDVVTLPADADADAESPALAEGGSRPTSLDLLAAVEDQLRSCPADDPGRRFADLVAANALAVVRRHHQLAGRFGDERRRILDELGVADERELSAQIREGRLEIGSVPALDLVGRLVDQRLAVNNPRWFDLP